MSAATEPAVSTHPLSTNPLSTHPGATDPVHRHPQKQPLGSRLISYLPRGNLLDDDDWHKRHRIVWSLLVLHLPALAVFGLWTHHTAKIVCLTLIPILVCLALESVTKRRRPKSFFTTAGIVYCSAAVVGLSRGSIEAHFHFFIIIGFIALYQDWVPFLWEIVFTVLSHGLGSAFRTDLIFDHQAGMEHPWLWSFIHGIAVLAACTGVVLFWRTNEEEQRKTLRLMKELAEADAGRFTSQLLVNLARRNQGMLYRQLEIINQLEEQEQDPDALAELFRLDHLATRIRRNAESFLVLSGEEPARVWSNPVPLFDVVRAAIAETEDLDRVGFMVDERLAVQGHAVTDLTHLLAELAENAVRFSPPGSRVTIRSTPEVRTPGAWVLTVEDWGIGVLPEDLVAINLILTKPRSIDVATSQRLGLHVVARLAHRHSIEVALTSTSMLGATAVVLLPAQLFAQAPRHVAEVRSGSSGRSPARDQLWPRAPVDNLALEAAAQVVAREPAGSERPTMVSTSASASIRLNRRRPQESLALELRGGQSTTRAAAPQVQPADASRARDALTRYQASRQAALATSNSGAGDPR